MNDRAILSLIHFNRPDACLRTVAVTRKLSPDLPILVLDNRSEAAARRALADGLRGAEGIELIWLEENLGYSGAIAAASRVAPQLEEYEVLMFGAHDIEVEGGSIGELADLVLHRGLGLVFAAREPLEEGCWRPMTGPRYRPLDPARLKADGTADGLFFPTPLFAVSAAAYRAGLRPDPRLFCYGEECDLGLRAVAMGVPSALAWRARVRNRELGGSLPVAMVQLLTARNRVLLSRWHSGAGWAMLCAARLLASGIRSCVSASAIERRLGVARTRGALLGAVGREFGPRASGRFAGTGVPLRK